MSFACSQGLKCQLSGKHTIKLLSTVLLFSVAGNGAGGDPVCEALCENGSVVHDSTQRVHLIKLFAEKGGPLRISSRHSLGRWASCSCMPSEERTHD